MWPHCGLVGTENQGGTPAAVPHTHQAEQDQWSTATPGGSHQNCTAALLIKLALPTARAGHLAIEMILFGLSKFLAFLNKEW